jgi:non-ribosomal peptide synthase protein (TIGR01720 family)
MLPLDQEEGEDLVGTAERVSAGLSEQETALLLQKVPAVYRTRINDVLLAALGLTIAEWTGERRVLVELEGHGREEVFEEVDLSRTVGWFTTQAPVLLEMPGSGDPVESLREMKRQLRGVAERLLEYGLLRYMGPQEVRQQLAAMPRAEVSFNYLGQWDSLGQGGGLLWPSERSAGGGRAAEERRAHPLEVNAMVVGGRLEVEWEYSPARHRRETVARRAERFAELLRELGRG